MVVGGGHKKQKGVEGEIKSPFCEGEGLGLEPKMRFLQKRLPTEASAQVAHRD